MGMQTTNTQWTVAGEERESFEARIDFALRLRPPGRPCHIDVAGYRFYDGRESINLSFRGPRGGYRGGVAFERTECRRLESYLSWLADYILPGGVEPIECIWGETLRLEQVDRRARWMIVTGPRRERERVQLTADDCHDLRAALRFVREYLEAIT